jgi:hypothetical protein
VRRADGYWALWAVRVIGRLSALTGGDPDASRGFAGGRWLRRKLMDTPGRVCNRTKRLDVTLGWK